MATINEQTRFYDSKIARRNPGKVTGANELNRQKGMNMAHCVLSMASMISYYSTTYLRFVFSNIILLL